MNHTEVYFAIRNYLLFGMAGTAITLTILLIITSLLSNLFLNRKFRYLEKIGFERHLISVASVGNHADWGWKRTKTDGSREIISDSEIKKNSLSYIKKKYTEQSL